MIPLVLIPGLLCDARLFTPQINALSGQCSLLIPNLAECDSIADMAQSVLHQAPPQFALAGLSMGGIVAMEIVRQSPDRVDRLALLDTNPMAETDAVYNRRNAVLADCQVRGFIPALQHHIIPLYCAHINKSNPFYQQVFAICTDMAETIGIDTFARHIGALQNRPDQQGALRRVACPTLIVCGACDALCSVDKHRSMHTLVAGSQLHIVPACGHLTTLESPAAVNGLLQQWLSVKG